MLHCTATACYSWLEAEILRFIQHSFITQMWKKTRLGSCDTQVGLFNNPIDKQVRFFFFVGGVLVGTEQASPHSVYLIRVKCSFCCPSAADPEQAFWVIMVHYRQATFHCYILSCVVSGDKQTTVLISVRRKNTWLEPSKSALSFCHWLRPSGPNKVFPFESTAAGDYMGALLRHISAFFGAPFRTSSVWVTASLQCQIWWEPITTFQMHLFHFSSCGIYDVCLDLRTRPLCSLDLGPKGVNQSTRNWQF